MIPDCDIDLPQFHLSRGARAAESDACAMYPQIDAEQLVA